MNYELIESQLKELIESCPIALSTMANAASLIYHGMENLNWAGFYVLRGNELVLGPFIGKPACTRIPIGKGVCGTAVKERRVQRVENVHLFPGHIACDSASQSEIVIPLIRDDVIYGVLDIDSPVLSRFTEADQEGLERICDLMMASLDWAGGLLA
ncbi:MAG: GAF domain-containing protein [Clostridia bacterium]|nr:GAF domain-containing protein [Clostridia bacterium]